MQIGNGGDSEVPAVLPRSGPCKPRSMPSTPPAPRRNNSQRSCAPADAQVFEDVDVEALPAHVDFDVAALL
eukprot:1972147-Alexandrium_andersonii.AAC.1